MGHTSATFKDLEDTHHSDLDHETGAGTGSVCEVLKGILIPLNYDTVSDEVLVELYKNKRDENALSSIIRRYRDTILGFAMRMTKNPMDAEDIVQEISLTLVRKLDTFKGNSKFSTWLYKVTLNTCYMVLNKTKKTKEHELGLDYMHESLEESLPSSPEWTENPDRLALCRESAQMLRGAVNELSYHNREIVRLKDMEGYSNTEVSEIMGISVSAVKSRLLRSRLTLRKRLGFYFQENV